MVSRLQALHFENKNILSMGGKKFSFFSKPLVAKMLFNQLIYGCFD
jgi:hypothetical protein